MMLSLVKTYSRDSASGRDCANCPAGLFESVPEHRKGGSMYQGENRESIANAIEREEIDLELMTRTSLLWRENQRDGSHRCESSSKVLASR